ncbi:hypothetical protein BC832DRAFT_592965 [Gaertneriomyces semiglobifer]|nr:hypothetical protein BC832DRAFT_592965 [Gaertneriomyces semiglobifer]
MSQKPHQQHRQQPKDHDQEQGQELSPFPSPFAFPDANRTTRHTHVRATYKNHKLMRRRRLQQQEQQQRSAQEASSSTSKDLTNKERENVPSKTVAPSVSTRQIPPSSKLIPSKKDKMHRVPLASKSVNTHQQVQLKASRNPSSSIPTMTATANGPVVTPVKSKRKQQHNDQPPPPPPTASVRKSFVQHSPHNPFAPSPTDGLYIAKIDAAAAVAATTPSRRQHSQPASYQQQRPESSSQTSSTSSSSFVPDTPTRSRRHPSLSNIWDLGAIDLPPSRSRPSSDARVSSGFFEQLRNHDSQQLSDDSIAAFFCTPAPFNNVTLSEAASGERSLSMELAQDSTPAMDDDKGLDFNIEEDVEQIDPSRVTRDPPVESDNPWHIHLLEPSDANVIDELRPLHPEHLSPTSPSTSDINSIARPRLPRLAFQIFEPSRLIPHRGDLGENDVFSPPDPDRTTTRMSRASTGTPLSPRLFNLSDRSKSSTEPSFQSTPSLPSATLPRRPLSAPTISKSCKANHSLLPTAAIATDMDNDDLLLHGYGAFAHVSSSWHNDLRSVHDVERMQVYQEVKGRWRLQVKGARALERTTELDEIGQFPP